MPQTRETGVQGIEFPAKTHFMTNMSVTPELCLVGGKRKAKDSFMGNGRPRNRAINIAGPVRR